MGVQDLIVEDGKLSLLEWLVYIKRVRDSKPAACRALLQLYEKQLLSQLKQASCPENAPSGKDFDDHLWKMALAVQIFKRHKMKTQGNGREDSMEQPRKHWEDAFGAAKDVIKGLVKEYPVQAWQEPTMDTFKQFLSDTGEITKAKVLSELDKTGSIVDPQLFLVACVVNLMRSGQAQQESEVKPNNGNKFDEAMEKLISEGSSGKPDELPPVVSVDLVVSLQQRTRDILHGTCFENYHSLVPAMVA